MQHIDKIKHVTRYVTVLKVSYKHKTNVFSQKNIFVAIVHRLPGLMSHHYATLVYLHDIQQGVFQAYMRMCKWTVSARATLPYLWWPIIALRTQRDYYVCSLDQR